MIFILHLSSFSIVIFAKKSLQNNMDKNIDEQIAQAIQNIKKFRELRNITREEISSELDLSNSGYSKIERGETEITLSKLYKIAEILKVNVSQILNFDTTTIFNITNNHGLNGQINGGQYHSDIFKEKYIKMLELENEELKNKLSQLKGSQFPKKK